eukprot:846501-Rhodomonas_salina.1
MFPIILSTFYPISGTDIAHRAMFPIILPSCYPMSAYRATHMICDVRLRIILLVFYAMSGTETGYGATRSTTSLPANSCRFKP